MYMLNNSGQFINPFEAKLPVFNKCLFLNVVRMKGDTVCKISSKVTSTL
jgi:hypothetical protein